jgi:NAD(P)H-nitrite reductase large subunit
MNNFSDQNIPFSVSTDNIVIIGNGISGVTCARHIRKLNSYVSITIISAETDYFYSRTALMYVYMGHMKFEHTKPYEDWFWKKNRINLLNKFVLKVDVSSQTLTFSDGTEIKYGRLVIATGSQSNKFGWPGQDLIGVQGLYNYQDLQSMEENTKGIKRAVIVGGGLIGIEMAEMLSSRNIPVTFLVREKNFWSNILPEEESQLINRHIIEHGIDLRLGAELKEIKGSLTESPKDTKERVKSIITGAGEEIECQFVGLTVGVNPNISFLKDSGIKIDRGVMINEFFETNIKNIYAIGDCAQFKNPLNGRRPIEQVWYTGKKHGETLAQTICGNRTTYNPGNWFNSAKFFDIEYQTYGMINSKIEEDESTVFWEHPDGKICFRALWDKNKRNILGINVFGIRMRHKVFDQWISDQKSIEYVMENLKEANFDPEFFKQYEREIIEKFNQETNSNIKLKKSSLLKKLFA